MIGTVTGIPSDTFSFTRSYIEGWKLTQDFDFESRSGGHYIFNDFRFYNDRIHIILRPQGYAWSSNHYTLAGFFEEAYFYALPSTTPTPLNLTVKWVNPTPTSAAWLEVRVSPFSLTMTDYPLPPVDRPYWLPSP